MRYKQNGDGNIVSNQEKAMHSQKILEVHSHNYGIDMLRVISMLYIVILHFLGLGGALEVSAKGSLNYLVGWYVQMWVYCAVDIFAIISGYVGYSDTERNYNYAKYILLWLQVVFWSVALNVVFCVLGFRNIGVGEFVRALIPVTSNAYWYFTAYTGLFIMIPLLNAAVRNSSKASLRWQFAAMIIIFSLYSTFGDRWKLFDGYSMIWLMVLYLLGAIIKKCGFGETLTQSQVLAGIVICTLVSWLWVLYENKHGFLINKSLVQTYLTPMHLISAMLHVVFFSRLHFAEPIKKWIRIAASGAFAVYIINCHKTIMETFVAGKLKWMDTQPVYIFVGYILGSSIVFVVICIVADYFREKLFDILHIRKYTQMLADNSLKFADTVMRKLFFSKDSR